MADLGSIAVTILSGVGMVGRGLTQAVQYMLSCAGLQVPDVAITIASIIFLILLLYKFGGAVNKIVLFALVFLLLSNVAGLINPWLGVAGTQ